MRNAFSSPLHARDCLLSGAAALRVHPSLPPRRVGNPPLRSCSDDCDGAELLLCFGLQRNSADGAFAGGDPLASVRAVLAYLEEARPWRAPAAAGAVEGAAGAVRPHYAPTLRVGPGRHALEMENE